MITAICANSLCGKTFLYKDSANHFKRAEQHFCSRSCQNTTHGLTGTPRHKMWEWVKSRARKNGVIFTLTLQDIPEFPTHCPILGIHLCPNDKVGPLDSSPSMDRLDPSLGYVPGNIRIISNRANRLRSDASAKELALLATDAQALEEARG